MPVKNPIECFKTHGASKELVDGYDAAIKAGKSPIEAAREAIVTEHKSLYEALETSKGIKKSTYEAPEIADTKKISDKYDKEIRDIEAAENLEKIGINSTQIKENETDNLPEIKRLSPEEEQGRIRAGKTAIHATAILEKLHQSMRGDREKIIEAEKLILEDYARLTDIWVESVDDAYLKSDKNEQGKVIDNTRTGMEQTAYFDDAGNVVKANRNTMHTTILDLMDSIALHNLFDTHTGYEVTGFGKNSKGEFVTILKQRFIEGTEPTNAEVYDDMILRGFVSQAELESDEIQAIKDRKNLTDKQKDALIKRFVLEDKQARENFISREAGLTVEDLHLKNVIKDKNGELRYIDPIVELDDSNKGLGGNRNLYQYENTDTEAGNKSNEPVTTEEESPTGKVPDENSEGTEEAGEGQPPKPPVEDNEGKVDDEGNKLSGIRKKLVSEKIIENVDLNRIGDKDMMELGRKIIDSGEVNPELLVQKIITEKQGVLTPAEVVALITYKADIDNGLRDAYRKANEKKEAGEDLGTLGIEIKDLERQVDDFDVMAVITANQQSMAFRLRSMMLDRNYNVITQIEKYKKNNDGYIPPEIEARFRELDKELKEVKEKLANAERLAAEKEGQESVDNIKESIGREKTYTDEQLEKKIQEGVESEISKLYEELPSEKRGLADKAIAALEKFRAKIKARGSAYDATIGIPIAIADLGAATAIRAIKVGKTVAEAVKIGVKRIKDALKAKGIDVKDWEERYTKDLTDILDEEGVSTKPVKDKPVINEDGTVKIPNEMLRNLVKRGVTDIGDLTDAVHEQVVKDLPDISKRQVRDYITDYGKKVNLTADELQTQVNTAKRVGRLLSELEDLKKMSKIEFLAKYQKPKPADNKITEREQELKKQIKSLGKDIAGNENVDNVGKDAAERHQKRIDDLEKELLRIQERRSKEKTEPNKSKKTIPEDEQKILDEIEAEQTKWDEERDAARQLSKDYQKLETERNRQLKRVGELNDIIKILEGGNLPQAEIKTPKKDTPEIEALKAEKNNLEKQVRESIAHENKMKELDKELQRLKDRKEKEPKSESKRVIGQDERLKRDEIEAERKAWNIENNIDKLNTELQRIRSRQQKVTDPKEKRELTDTEKNILQEIKDEKAAWVKEVEPERRVRGALKAAQKSLEDYERRITENDFSKKDVTETPLTPELKSLREKRDAKRKEYEKLKKDTVAKIPKTDAEILKAAKERTKSRIAELERKINNKDFAKPVKKLQVTDTELTDLNKKKEKLQDEFDDAQYKLELKNRRFWQKAEDAALELTSGLVRGLVASLDMSAGFVQGLWRLFSNPVNSAKAFGTMFSHFKSEKASQDYMDKLKAQSYYPLLQASKLAIDDKAGKISAREGFFISNWVNHIYDFAAKVITLNYKPATQFLQRINPYKASARAFDGYVNSIRVNSFIDLAKSMEKDGYTFEADSKDFQKAADFVNTTTGRGSLGAADASSRWLNIFFFAPRKVISEVKLFTPYAFVYYARMPKSVRKKALLNLATFMGNFVLVNGLLWAASKAGGDDDDEEDNFWNANSSDFLTHKIGNKRISIAGGAKSMLVFQSRLWSGKFTDQYGNREKLGERYGKPINTRLDLVWRFVLGKGSPAVSVIAKKFDEKKGFESSDGEIIKDLTVPIWMQDLKELYKDSPKEVSTLLAALSFFGANVRTVDEGNKKKTGFKIYSTSINGESGVRYSTPKEDKEVIEYKDTQTEEKLKAIKERGTVWLNKYGEMTIDEDENSSTKSYDELSEAEVKDLKSRLREQAGREAKAKIKF